VGLQKRLLQQWLQPFYPEEAPPTLVEMSQLTEFLAKYDTSKHEAKYKHLPKARYHASIEGASQETSNPIYLRVCRDSISLTTECPKRHRTKIITPQSELCLSVTVPGTFFHAGLKKNLVIRDISNNERKRFTNQGLQSRGFEVMVNLDWWMDIAKQLSEGEAHPWALTLRPRQTGDRFMPLGMPTTVSLKRYLINHKVPVHLRDTLPLLVAGDNQVLWIPGIGISDACRVEEKPTHVLKIVHAEAPIPTHKKVRYQTLAELEALPQGHSTIEGDILKEEDTDGLPLPLRDKVLLDTLEPSSQEEENTALL
jgi:tRNA(Ile)-lysidine synthetase-like protein